MMKQTTVGMKPDFAVQENPTHKERYVRECAELQKIYAAM